MIRINISREMVWLENSNLKNYDIVVSSHILEGLKKRITNMIMKLKKPYIIDPYTYIFGNDVRDIREKRWFSKLIENYGLDLIIDPDTLNLSPDLLIDRNNQPTDNLKELVENVVTYQRTKVQEIYDEISEFAEFETEKTETFVPKPRWVIPPYFFLEAGAGDWLTVNIQSIRLAIENRDNSEKIFAVIMIDRDLLSYEEDIDEIIEGYKILGVDGYMIWSAYMDENSAKSGELQRFQSFVSKLSNHKKPIYNMYGGLFSFLLKEKGMTGSSHSLCYGEHKNPFTTGGMAATIRFYQTFLHSKVPFARIKEIESALELEKCDCEYCGMIHETDDKSEQMELAGKHFLLNRIKELEEIDSNGTMEFLAKLTRAAEHANQNDKTGAYSNLYDRFTTWGEIIN